MGRAEGLCVEGVGLMEVSGGISVVIPVYNSELSLETLCDQLSVELPNIEVGVASNREGLIPPSGREALRIMNIHSARDFAASLVAQVLAGEFNLALEISREKLYAAEKIKE